VLGGAGRSAKENRVLLTRMTVSNPKANDSDESHVVTVELGSPSDDYVVAFGQALVLIPGLIIAWPDFVLLQRGDRFQFVALAFALMLVAITTFCVVRCLIRPRPMILEISRTRISYDSGRPGVQYLMDRSCGIGQFFADATMKRQSWTIEQRDVRPSIAKVLSENNQIVVKPNDRVYRVTHLIPTNVQPRLTKQIQAWLASEPPVATENAS